MSINELRAITTFVQTAEFGSLSKAAKIQQITPQAASKALGQLEEYLGIRLFHRTTRSMSLTEEGLRFLEAAKPSVVGLHQALQTARHTREDIAGPLRITGPRTVLQSVIGPVLDEFIQLYPEVHPDLEFNDSIGNWVDDRVDVGFRLGHTPQEGLIARRLFPMQLIICAAPSYLRKYGVPQNLYELATHRCSAFRRTKDDRVMPWSVKIGENTVNQHINPSFCTNDEVFELRTILAGDVIGQLAAPTAADLIRLGHLVPLLIEHVVDHYSLYVYYGSRTALPARVRCFIDLVVERLKDNPKFILSREELADANQFVKTILNK